MRSFEKPPIWRDFGIKSIVRARATFAAVNIAARSGCAGWANFPKGEFASKRESALVPRYFFGVPGTAPRFRAQERRQIACGVIDTHDMATLSGAFAVRARMEKHGTEKIATPMTRLQTAAFFR